MLNAISMHERLRFLDQHFLYNDPGDGFVITPTTSLEDTRLGSTGFVFIKQFPGPQTEYLQSFADKNGFLVTQESLLNGKVFTHVYVCFNGAQELLALAGHVQRAQSHLAQRILEQITECFEDQRNSPRLLRGKNGAFPKPFMH